MYSEVTREGAPPVADRKLTGNQELLLRFPPDIDTCWGRFSIGEMKGVEANLIHYLLEAAVNGSVLVFIDSLNRASILWSKI